MQQQHHWVPVCASCARAVPHVRAPAHLDAPWTLFPGGIVVTCATCGATTTMDARSRWVRTGPTSQRAGNG